jgi:glycerate dehydrogenase
MNNTVFLNSARLDFDNNLDFSALSVLTNVTKYANSSDSEILERVQYQNIVITKELSLGRDLILQFPPSVKLICEAGTGYNNIDLAAAKEKNITVCNIPGYSTEAVAQLVITFILTLSSSITKQQLMLKNKDFSNFTKHLGVPHFELLNKTLGVIGAGAIGNQVIKVARALGMKVLVHSRTPKQWSDSSIQSVSVEELLKQSDFITLHCPLTSSTKYLINKDTINLMKPSAFIINTARGAIIKESDLIEALQNKVISGAGLDVQDPEPPQLDNPLFDMENVILTPHIGWKAIEARQRLLKLISENIKSFIENNPINVVN